MNYKIQIWFNDKWEINAENMNEEVAKNNWNTVLLLERYGFTRPARLIDESFKCHAKFDPLNKLTAEKFDEV